MEKTGRKKTRFQLVGGFLGAGKTTTVLQLARSYAARGLRIGIIANDHAEGLVDSEIYRDNGFDTEEIPEGCFCCKFGDLLSATERFTEERRADIVLAEPVGSCTDLVNAVIRPLQHGYAARIEVAPYVALLDPRRALEALTAKGPRALSARVTYIYKMQQNEADIIAVNKCDLLTPEELKLVQRLAARNFPKARIMAISAASGEGLDALRNALAQDTGAGAHATQVDYAAYGEGEAALGWLNARLQIRADCPFDPVALLQGVLGGVQRQLRQRGAEPTHLKAFIRTAHGNATANVVHRQLPAESSSRVAAKVSSAEMLVNGRAECPSALLWEALTTSVTMLESRQALHISIVESRHLSPSPPIPPRTAGLV